MAPNTPKKPDLKKPKFSPYWIYAAILLGFLGLQFFGGNAFNGVKNISQAEFERFYQNGDYGRL